MDLNKFKIDMEKPIHNSIEAVFERASLSDAEKNIYLKYRKVCEYWLLRSMLDSSQNLLSDRPNFIKQLARLLINLNHKDVVGPKHQLVKEFLAINPFIYLFQQKEEESDQQEIPGKSLIRILN